MGSRQSRPKRPTSKIAKKGSSRASLPAAVGLAQQSASNDPQQQPALAMSYNDAEHRVRTRHHRIRTLLRDEGIQARLVDEIVMLLEADGAEPVHLHASTSRQTRTGPAHSHLIIIPGVPPFPDGQPSPPLQARIDRGVFEASRDPSAVFIVTGGAVQPPHRYSEASVMKAGLVSAGVDPRRIWEECRATTTVDNGARVLDMLVEQAKQDRARAMGTIDHGPAQIPWPYTKITIVAEPYHAFRCLRIFHVAIALANEFSGPRPLLHLAPADRHPAYHPHNGQRVIFRSEPRLAFGRTPEQHGQFLGELARYMEEKRKMKIGW